MNFFELKAELKKKERSLSIALRARYQINLLYRILDRALYDNWQSEELREALHTVIEAISTELPIKGEKMREYEKKKRALLRDLNKIYHVRPAYTYYQQYAVIGTLVSLVVVSLFFQFIGDAFIHASWSSFPVSLFIGALVGLSAEVIARRKRHTL